MAKPRPSYDARTQPSSSFRSRLDTAETSVLSAKLCILASEFFEKEKARKKGGPPAATPILGECGFNASFFQPHLIQAVSESLFLRSLLARKRKVSQPPVGASREFVQEFFVLLARFMQCAFKIFRAINHSTHAIP